MENKKTVVEKLREYTCDNECSGMSIHNAATGTILSDDECQNRSTCSKCREIELHILADAIEAEQAELRERVDELNSTFIDLAALDLLCEKLDMSPDLRGIAEQIRAATKGFNPSKSTGLPEGIEWPASRTASW